MIVILYNFTILFASLFCCLTSKVKEGIVKGVKACCAFSKNGK